CVLEAVDADHFSIRLGAGRGVQAETINYVRATRSLIFDWELHESPTYRVGTAVRACGLGGDAGWLDQLDVGRMAILVDQLLFTSPMLLLLAWHAARGWPARRRRLILLVGLPSFAFLLSRRLQATGTWDDIYWIWRALCRGDHPWLR
ncbi:hypothetical protein T492DRAFT_873054, partial [Pavlovales sp. CCMP2436]